MKRVVMVIVLMVGLVLPLEGLAACSTGPSRKSSATVRVAALTFPGGGASHAVLSLYKAALEVNRNNPDLDLKIVTVSPPQPEPGVMMNEPALVWQNGGEIVSKDGGRSQLTEPAALEAIKFYYDLINTYKVVPPMPKPAPVSGATMPTVGRAIQVGEVPPLWGPGGRVAMQVMSGAGSSYAGNPFFRSGGDRPFRLVEMPRGKVPATLMDVQVAIAMTSRAQDGTMAYKAMIALAEEMQKEISVPARRSLAKKLREISPNVAEEDVPVILNSLEYARALPSFAYTYGKKNPMSVLYEKLMNPLQQGTKKPEEAAKEASDAMDEMLNQ